MSDSAWFALGRAVSLAKDLVLLLDGEERALGERLVAMAASSVDAAGASDELEFRREMNRLVELLARRSARAMPLGALGRGVLAALGGDRRESERLVGEFEGKLALLGLL